MIKLVVSDFDGTLFLSNEGNVSERIIQRISSIIDKGIPFAVSSGRVLQELKYYFPTLAEKIYFISSDGALVTFGDKTIFQKSFSSNDICAYINYAGDGKLRFFSDNKIWCFGDSENEFSDDIKINKYFDIKKPVYKIVYYNKNSNIDSLNIGRLHYSDDELFEYVPVLANKGIALSALQMHLGISTFETLAMGDFDNDIPMMKNAKYSVSVGNRPSEIHNRCCFHSESAVKILDKVWLNGDFNT